MNTSSSIDYIFENSLLLLQQADEIVFAVRIQKFQKLDVILILRIIGIFLGIHLYQFPRHLVSCPSIAELEFTFSILMIIAGGSYR